MNSTNKLTYPEFEAVSSKQWKQQIQFELKGADYNDTVVWDSPEGFKVRPFYHYDDLPEQITQHASGKRFSICQDIYVHDINMSVNRAKDTLNRGAEVLRFTIPSPIQISDLLTEIPSSVTIFIRPLFLDHAFMESTDRYAAATGQKIHLLCDPVGQLASDGNWFKTSDKDNFEALQKAATLDHISILSVDMTLYHNAGATVVQQLAYGAGQFLEYLNKVPNISGTVVMQVAIGSDYFFEIAKLRALRSIISLLAKEFGTPIDCCILAVPGTRNKTLYDYNVNMLRTTTECMSAILGGADVVANFPYDGLYHKDNEFADRIARNQLLIMRHESYLDEVRNPVEGSYYIETITSMLCEKALELLKDIEKNGGFLKQLGNGVIERKISESALAEQKRFDSNERILLGTNKYPNPEDRMKADLELYPFVKVKPRKTLISPIIPKRLAEQAEQERLSKES